jgi:hypothetical protein
MKNELEKIFKDKLKEDGINEEWMKKHLVIDTITDEDIKELLGDNDE